jgi:glycosyltransferase involved in cell wall biosynthesis
MTVSFIGSAGIPNRYGGFEAFLEHCTPSIVARGIDVIVTCDARLYRDKEPFFSGVRRLFIGIPANGAASVVHDAVAFFRVFFQSDQIIVLGVSGGLWFPIFRILCEIAGKNLIVNIDGVEWRRTKFSPAKRKLIKFFDSVAQRFAHHVVYDNEALFEYVNASAKTKATCISYSGDHVLRLKKFVQEPGTALTVCRIEPENNLELMIEGFLSSRLVVYTIVGNWNGSEYSRSLQQRYASNARLRLLDPIYAPDQLAELRECCNFYLHGHSVGGTNPSLVEMLFYDCVIICFDVEFNRRTAGNAANYVSTAHELKTLLDGSKIKLGDRENLRLKYTRKAIVDAYLKII